MTGITNSHVIAITLTVFISRRVSISLCCIWHDSIITDSRHHTCHWQCHCPNQVKDTKSHTLDISQQSIISCLIYLRSSPALPRVHPHKENLIKSPDKATFSYQWPLDWPWWMDTLCCGYTVAVATVTRALLQWLNLVDYHVSSSAS